jgi:transposase InsO family protein
VQAELIERIKEIAATRVRYGYRRIHVLLRRDGWRVNPKRVYRLYRELGLQLRTKTPKRRVKAKLRDDRCPATRSNETWAIDFVHDQLATGRKLRVLTIVVCHSRQIDKVPLVAACPLHLRQRLQFGTAAKWRFVPFADLSRCSNMRVSRARVERSPYPNGAWARFSVRLALNQKHQVRRIDSDIMELEVLDLDDVVGPVAIGVSVMDLQEPFAVVEMQGSERVIGEIA